MCGLFGLVRSTRSTHPEPASGVFAALGRLAERRGHDAAGFAVAGLSLPPVVVKAPLPFRSLWDSRQHAPMLHAATVALGHTRHASLGVADRLANTHPLEAGSLVGTHNGELDTDDFQRRIPGLPAPQGETDSERLLQALDRVRSDPQGVCGVLAAMRGPAALAFLDRDRPGRVYLARGALVPLAVARDAWGNLYWGSSPAWFRRLDEQAGGRLGFEVERVREGTVLVVEVGGEPAIVAERLFVPTARPGDEEILSVWEGLDPLDVLEFQAEARHLVASGPPAVKAAA